MEKAKLTVRVPKALLEGAKRYASQHHTTLSELVSEFLRQLPTEGDYLAEARTKRFLSGLGDAGEYEQESRALFEERYEGPQT